MSTQFALGYSEYTGEAGQAATRERFDWESGEITATRIFKGPWEDRIDFVNDHLDKEYPDLPQAKLANVEILGIGVASVNSDTGQASWDTAQLTVTYKTLQQETPASPTKPQTVEDFSNRRFIEESLEGRVEILQVDASDYWVDSAANAQQFGTQYLQENEGLRLNALDKINLLDPTEILTLKQQFVGVPFWTEMHMARGKVNNNCFIAPSGIAFAAESLRYDGTTGRTKIDVDTRGSEDNPFPVWELEHSFAHKIVGWNTRLVDGKWQRIVAGRDDGAGGLIQGNFPLFQNANLYSIFFGAGRTAFSTSTLTEIDILLNAAVNSTVYLLPGDSVVSRGGVIQRALNVNGMVVDQGLLRLDIRRIKRILLELGFNV